MKLRTFIRESGISIAIVVTVLLVGSSASLSFYVQHQSKQFDSVKEKTGQVIGMIDSIFLFMNDMDKSVRGFLVAPDDRFLATHHAAGQQSRETFEALYAFLKAQQFPGAEKTLMAGTLMDGYYGTLNEIIALKKQGDEAGMIALYHQDKGTDVWNNYRDFTNEVRTFEQAIYDEAEEKYQFYLKAATITQALLIIMGVPTLLFVLYQLRKSNKARNLLFDQLEDSQRKYLFNDKFHHKHQDEKAIISGLIENLGRASHFIRQISQGDYSVTWEGITDDNQQANQENLAGALTHMRGQMKQMKQADQQRLWSTEGLSKVAEITRKYQDDAQLLADSLLSYLVSYTESNQGSLFFLQEDKTGGSHLALAACYAYDKKKHAEKTVKIGQGLAGQTYQERKTMHLTKIPDQYVAITSGLGEATPNALLIVPLIFNEQAMGVLEVATFNTFQAHKIAFLENVGEIIASAVATVRMNERTKALLEQSQEGTEMLRAQEEEMRQNMEEIQATQEEMERKAKEYEAIIEEQQAKIQQSEKADS